MKGIILAGGKGTRLHPLTKITNKHLLPVGREAMIIHPLKQLIMSGIIEILVVTSNHHMGDVVNLLGSGHEYGCDLTYKVQEDAKGIADALALAENFANGEDIVVLLGDNIFEYSIAPFVERFAEQGGGARVLLKQVGDPTRYGVASLDEQHILEIEEKPNQPQSDYAVVGCYMYDANVFSYIRDIKPSPRGELEITSVNNIYIQCKTLYYDIIEGNWTDAGTFESLAEANEMLMGANNLIKTHASEEVEV